ncbi:hypothetical protein MMC26_005969 [Xylographa opegraphella]|nr:hypothetical protein [Xylographa opegraphella]
MTQNQHPYLPNQAATMSDQAHTPKYTNTLNTLHRRIAVLETELAQAVSDKIAAEHAMQYVLKLVATDRRCIMASSGSVEEMRLECEVRSVNAENAYLRSQLRKVVLPQKMTSHSEDAEYNANPETGASSICPNAVSGVSSVPQGTNTALVDLMDLEEIPGLDRSTGSSTSDDDIEQLNHYVRTIPPIDLVTKECSVPEVYKEPEQNETHFVRRFVQNSFGDAATLTVGDQSSVFEQDYTSNDLLVLGTSESCNGLRRPIVDSLDKNIAERRYSKDIYPEHASDNYKVGGAKTTVNAEVPAGVDFTTTLESLSHGTHSLEQELSIANETALSIIDPQLPPQSHDMFADATCGPSKLFTCVTDRESAIKNHRALTGFQECRFPDLFRCGIRYEPPASQTNTFRMVSIMNLPIDISLKELMAKIRGGTVVSCNLLDTRSITGTFSALVRFLHEHEALAYDDFAAAHPISFRGLRAQITIVKTPSWPLSLPHTKAIFNHHHTRSLEVVNFPRNVPPAQLTRDLRTHPIEHMQMRKDGILELKFSSIDHAGRAFGLLTTFRKYRECGVSFSEDPCALPLSTLLEPVGEGHSKTTDELVYQDNGGGKKNVLACAV